MLITALPKIAKHFWKSQYHNLLFQFPLWLDRFDPYTIDYYATICSNKKISRKDHFIVNWLRFFLKSRDILLNSIIQWRSNWEQFWRLRAPNVIFMISFIKTLEPWRDSRLHGNFSTLELSIYISLCGVRRSQSIDYRIHHLTCKVKRYAWIVFSFVEKLL